MLIKRACSFSLSHLTQFKLNEIQHTIQSLRSLTQDFITTLYHHCTNLALYNQQFGEGFESCKLTLNAGTQALIPPSHSHLGARWQSKCLKQAIDCLSSIDNKQTEQAYVLKKGKRRAKCPIFKGYPNLDQKFIKIHFKTDNPALLKQYPHYLLSEVSALDKDGNAFIKVKKTEQKVVAFSSKQWETLFGLTEFDMVVLMSRSRGDQLSIKRAGPGLHTESQLMIPLKQHKHFLKWLMTPNSKLLPFMELRQQDVTLVLEMEDTSIPTTESIINISDRPCFSIDSYPVNSTHSAKAKLRTYLKSVKPDQIWGCDIGQLKLAVLTNQDQPTLQNQERALFLGKDHKEWLDQRETLKNKVNRAVRLNKRKTVSANRENVPFVAQQKVLLRQYEQYIKEQIQSLPWDQMKVLVIENLNGIKIGGSGKKNLGRSFNKRNASWLVRQVQIGLAHYAQQNGVLLVQIDPKYTSLQCPSCEAVTVSKKGKVCHRDGETYYQICEKSGGVSLDADYVGAYNIRQRLFYWVKQGCMPYSKKAKTVNEAFEPIHNTQGAGVPSSD